ncbi:MAG: IS110 family transposase [Ktedonobacteraceae bacterium]
MKFCGIDWADAHHDALSIDEQGRQLGSIRVAHTPEGLSQLDAYLERIAGPGGKDELACIIETTHGLLIAHLLEQGWAVYPVNPRTVERRRAPSGAKTDIIDAYLLAKTGRADFQDLRRLNPDSEQIQELKTLTRDQDGLVQMQTRLVNQLTACLKAYYPVALEAFGKVQQPSTLAFLRAYPTLQAARAASGEELATLLKQARYPGARQKAEALTKHLQQPCLYASEVITRTKSRLMLALIDQLEPLLKQIAQYDKEIERLFLMHADSELFQSLPRAGARLAPRLLAELGDDRSRYDSANSLQALAGTSPVLFQSGTYQKAHRRLGCIKPWRNALSQFAWQSTHGEAWAKEYYQRKRAEGKSHTVAVRALANVWARIVYAVWKKKELYQTTTFEQARQAHAPRVA